MARMSPESVAALVLETIVKNEGPLDPPTGDQLNRATTATAIALCESGGDPGAVNPRNVGGSCSGSGSGHATGLFQIVPKCHPAYSNLTDPRANTAAAYSISGGFRRWGQWECTPGRKRDEAKRAVAVVFDLDDDGLAELLTGAASEVVSGASGVVGAITDPLEAVSRLLGLLTAGETWVRVLHVAAGFLLLLAGLGFVVAGLAT